MFGKQSKHQSGFALLIFLVIMMGLGGIALTGVTQGIFKEVKDKNFRHNERVLKEAKQALLQFAYNYPETNGNGPGRLPCPDTNNNGMPNSSINCSTNMGRLPWRQPNLNLYDIHDADGERLWYAVSTNFSTQEAAHLNSDTWGTITVRDQSGNIIFDGTNPGDLTKYGVAAVIIAPGRITARDGVMQDRSVANGDLPFDVTNNPDTDTGIISADNYLDLFTDSDGIVTDNAALKQNSDTGGFILGPVNEQSTDVVPVDKRSADVVNDQIIIITAAEVIEMAEKATLQAYRNAINTYRTNIRIDTPSFDAYPWLDDYSINSAYPVDNLATYDATDGVRLGRVPSIFTSYFDSSGSTPASRSFLSDLNFEMNVNNFPVSLGAISVDASMEFNLGGDLLVTPSSPVSMTSPRYYWDEVISPNGWELCPFETGTEQDCNQATLNPGVPDSKIDPNELATRVVRIIPNITLFTDIQFTRPYDNNALIYRAPTVVNHAEVLVEYTDSISGSIDVSYEYDDYYLNSFDIVDTGNEYQLGIRYYPVLPAWALAANDNWHDSIQMAFSSGFQPGVITPGCTAPGTPGSDCLTVNYTVGVVNNKRAVLVLASDHDLVDGPLVDGFQNDLDDIFDAEHTQADGVDGQDVFDARSGNDQILIIR
jgi:type II secretory pathway pseudopilin PulG